jgi:alkylated DNA repair dioxygenase AlkB
LAGRREVVVMSSVTRFAWAKMEIKRRESWCRRARAMDL